MNTEIKDFCKKYKQKLVNDEDIKKNKQDTLTDCRDRIKFKVHQFEDAPGYYRANYMGYSGSSLFELDAEDLQYLYNKYSKKLEAEMNRNIEKVKQEYGQ